MTDTGTCGHTEARTDGTTYGPCVLPRGHIQPDHQDAAGVRWGPLADLAEAWNSTAQHAARVLDALCAYLASAGQHAGIVAAASDEELRRTKGHAIAAKVRAEAAEERAENAEDRLRKAEREYAALRARAEDAEDVRDRWRERAEEAEHTIARLTAERDRLRAELADVHHDLKLCVGSDYSTAASAAVEACRRVAAAETELRRLRVELTASPVDRDALRARAAEALRDWHMRCTVVCEHTQIIDYGAAADAVLAVLRDAVDNPTTSVAEEAP